MTGVVISAQILSGGQSQKVALTTASAQSAALTGYQYILTPDVNCFVRLGVNPTAVSDGTDQILLANQTYRIFPIVPGQKFAFILATGTGNVYITPDA
jgi:hypothetical protein